MNASEFAAKWRRSNLSERSGAQQHFCDLCELVEHPKPADADPEGEWFTIEKGAAKQSGGEGWADVWKKGHFAWEYKGKHKDLDAAYAQLLQYREALENPPLLVVCDMDRIVVHTNFTGTASKVHDIPLLEFGKPANLEVIRALFHDPERLRPGVTREAITEEAAEHLAALAQRLRDRGLDPHKVARFLDRIVFCLFAEDIGLLPESTFTELLKSYRREPEDFAEAVAELFEAMAAGGRFGVRRIKHFDGDLFQHVEVIELDIDEIDAVHRAARLDWSAVDPTIFGTLFERGMDPAKRAQLGTHYTSRADIETLVEPVVMAPLRREWEQTRQTLDNLLATGKKRPDHSDDVAQPPSAVQKDTSSGHSEDAQRGAAVPHAQGQSDGQPPSAAEDIPLAKPTKAAYQRNLPHLQSEGKTYFVTFNTCKRWTLPKHVRGLVLNHCLREHGRKLHMHGLVVMPDHVHLVFTPLDDPHGQPFGLSEILGAIKGASAHTINKTLGRKGHVWQDESFDHILRSDESAVSKAQYVCENPVRRGLVERMEDYPWLWREWVEGTPDPRVAHL